MNPILHLLQRIRQSDLVKDSSTYLVSNVFNAAIPFALIPILTRLLTPEEYGKIAMFQVLVAALSAVTGLSVHGAANRKFYDPDTGHNEIKLFIGSCLQILIISFGVALLFISLFLNKFSELLSINPEWILFALIVSLSGFVINIRLGQWQIRKQARAYSGFQIFSGLLNALITLLLVVLILRGAEGRIEAIAIAAVVSLLVSLCFLHKDNLLSFFNWNPGYINEALRFGIPLIPHIIGVFLLTVIDRFVVKIELGLDKAGIYMVAVQFSMILALLFDAINKAYVPWLFERLRRDDVNEKQNIVKLTYFYFLLLLCLSLVGFIAGPLIVESTVGEEYKPAGNIIGWLVLGQVFGGMYKMVTNYIFYSKLNGRLSIVTITAGLLNLILIYFLISLIGLKGAAIAFCLTMFIQFVFTWWMAQKCHPMPWLNAMKAIET